MLIVGTKFGQLGNRLLLFGNVIANSIEHDYFVINPYFEEYKKYFEGTSNEFNSKYEFGLEVTNNKLLKRVLDSRFSYLTLKAPMLYSLFNMKVVSDNGRNYNMNEDGFINLAKDSTLIVNGWLFRDQENLLKHREPLREIFRPLESSRENIHQCISYVGKNKKILVGVHIRRGDYRLYKGGLYFYSLEAYAKIISHLNKLFKAKENKEVAFLICSDECIDLSVFYGLPVYSGTNHIIEDMYSLAECDYIIGPPSSYTRWSAYIGRKPLCEIRNIEKNISINDFHYVYE